MSKTLKALPASEAQKLTDKIQQNKAMKHFRHSQDKLLDFIFDLNINKFINFGQFVYEKYLFFFNFLNKFYEYDKYGFLFEKKKLLF